MEYILNFLISNNIEPSTALAKLISKLDKQMESTTKKVYKVMGRASEGNFTAEVSAAYTALKNSRNSTKGMFNSAIKYTSSTKTSKQTSQEMKATAAAISVGHLSKVFFDIG